ncbi:MAG: DNA/RNA non-specific endonuclease [Acidobacteria bacterium]|jgi:DNA/RNA endonuclease G (NUC1)|nr:DNA/RNA non-specific endonuclease [Acidobacteriota bacterium]
MKRFYLVLASFFMLAVGLGIGFQTKAHSEEYQLAQSQETVLVSPNIVISQFFGGGGLTNAPYTNDFVELFNRGTSPVSLNGWSVQYASASGTNWLVVPLTNVTLQPGQYYLIQFASNGTAGSALPTPDLIAPFVPEGFIPNLSSTSGKLALVNTTTKLPASTCPSDVSIVDLVGYGAAASCSEGARTADLSVVTAAKRNGDGCADTDNNAQDFMIGAPAPRNTSSPTNSCNLGGILQAGGAANPNVVSPGGTTLLTISVIPATSPPSTNIMVVGNLTDIGGAANQQFFDNGTNGDVTPNDNIFSYLATIPVGTIGGIHNVTATVSDAQSRTASVFINLTVNAPLPGEEPLLLGNPSNATSDIANENNYLMVKPQYSLSYNRSKATPNWVAWRLDSTWLGTTPRQDDFRPDPQLPNGWYQVTPENYSGSGYDRGHMTPSGDRTRSAADNSATFLMTNIIPQLAANNQGPWEEFESYCRTLANQGNELYIVSGGAGNAGTIAQGRIVVPQVTWKVVLVLPNGNNDLQRVTKGTRTIAIIVPNQPPLNINAPWRNFRVSVNAVEVLTSYNFFTNVPKNTQELLERRIDRE